MIEVRLRAQKIRTGILPSPLPRPRLERPHRCTPEQRDELAPFHSITSSARASSDGGRITLDTVLHPMLADVIDELRWSGL